jgi:Domain of unknown function (DUF4397)
MNQQRPTERKCDMDQRPQPRFGGRGLLRPSRVLATAALVAVVALSGLTSAQAQPAQGWLRFGHFASGTGAVDIYVDGALSARNVAFEQVTPYARVSAGSHTLAVLTAGSAPGTAPVLTASASVTGGSAATVAAFTDRATLSSRVYVDDLSAPTAGHAKLRIIPTLSDQPSVNVYAAPSPTPNQPPTVAANVDLSLAGAGTPALFSRVTFGLATPYADVPAGTYNVEVRAAASGQLLLTGQNWPVLAGTVASLVVLPSQSGPTLEVLRDAAGTGSLPAGGAATGAGGMARRSSPMPVWPAVAVLGFMSLVLASRRGRRTLLAGRPGGRRHPDPLGRV